MNKHFCIALLIATVIGGSFISCQKETPTQKSSNEVNEDGLFVTRERNPQRPLTDYSSKINLSGSTKADPDMDSYLGFSTRLEDYPFENAHNIGFMVMDLEKYRSDHPGYYSNLPRHDGTQTSIAFSGYERFEEKTNTSKSVNAGFNLNLKIFSIKAKSSYKKVFQENTSTTNQYVYGEYTNKYLDREYKILIPEESLDKLYLDYVHSDFIHSLYYLSPYSLLNYYGGFVITNYISGAQAKVLYRGLHSKYSKYTSEEKETSFEASVSASVKGSAGGGAEGSFMIGDGHSSTFDNDYSNVQLSVKTIGGLPVSASFTSPKEIENVSYDFSSWCSSLGDQSKLNIVEYPENSLVPMTAFIEEENIKDVFNRYYESGNMGSKFVEPYIQVTVRHFSGHDPVTGYDANELWVRAWLVGRYGDKIPLVDAMVKPRVMVDFYNSIQDLIPDVEVKCNMDVYNTDFSAPKYCLDGEPLIKEDITYKFNNTVLNSAKKFVDNKTGKTYLLTIDDSGNKVAYTYYSEDIIEDYCLEEYVASLPEATGISLKTIRKKYKLIAL